MAGNSVSPESQEKLREALRLLGEAVDRGEGLDESSRRKLAELLEEAKAVLGDGTALSAEDHAGVGQRFEDEVASFERSHPDVAYLLAQIVETLSGMGI